eukprot:15470296-Alexandrium_andersonii.AAC.1
MSRKVLTPQLDVNSDSFVVVPDPTAVVETGRRCVRARPADVASPAQGSAVRGSELTWPCVGTHR